MSARERRRSKGMELVARRLANFGHLLSAPGPDAVAHGSGKGVGRAGWCGEVGVGAFGEGGGGPGEAREVANISSHCSVPTKPGELSLVLPTGTRRVQWSAVRCTPPGLISWDFLGHHARPASQLTAGPAGCWSRRLSAGMATGHGEIQGPCLPALAPG